MRRGDEIELACHQSSGVREIGFGLRPWPHPGAGDLAKVPDARGKLQTLQVEQGEVDQRNPVRVGCMLSDGQICGVPEDLVKNAMGLAFGCNDDLRSV